MLQYSAPTTVAIATCCPLPTPASSCSSQRRPGPAQPAARQALCTTPDLEHRTAAECHGLGQELQPRAQHQPPGRLQRTHCLGQPAFHTGSDRRVVLRCAFVLTRSSVSLLCSSQPEKLQTRLRCLVSCFPVAKSMQVHSNVCGPMFGIKPDGHMVWP